MQSDSHLRFAPDWDRHYKEDLRLARSYPKAILSTYPSGFKDGDPPYMGGPKAPRLCTCEFPGDEGKHSMIRINTGHDCKSEQDAPTQIAYIAAGFFFTRSEFLVDVPFDPYLPWIFMGEEIALSLRAWTHGWDAYAPRKDWIAHQYRPGKLGLPKFWENTARVFGGRGGFDNEVSSCSHPSSYCSRSARFFFFLMTSLLSCNESQYNASSTWLDTRSQMWSRWRKWDMVFC